MCPFIETAAAAVKTGLEIRAAAKTVEGIYKSLEEGELAEAVTSGAKVIAEKKLNSLNDVKPPMKLPDASGEPKYKMKLPDPMNLRPPEAHDSGRPFHADDSGEKRLEALDKLVKEYWKDLLEKSEYPKTLLPNQLNPGDLKKIEPDEVARKREEFVDKKADLKREWENIHGIPWPKYTEDVYSQNGKLIRKAGSDYDAHHIQPLCMGGENTAQNITPMHASEHYDKQGIHAPGSPYDRLERQLGGK